VDIVVDHVDQGFGLVLDLVCLNDIHLMYNLTYVGLDSIWSPGLT
jgi:hypothetical protein